MLMLEILVEKKQDKKMAISFLIPRSVKSQFIICMIYFLLLTLYYLPIILSTRYNIIALKHD